MAITDQCKFEVKANVDKVQREKKLSRRRAIAVVADEIGLIEETVRKQDQRARRELGQVVPRPKASSQKAAPNFPSNLTESASTHSNQHKKVQPPSNLTELRKDDEPVTVEKVAVPSNLTERVKAKNLSPQDVHVIVMSRLHMIASFIGSGHPGDKKTKAALIMKVHATIGKFTEAINAMDDLVGVSFTEFRPDPADVESLVQSWRAER